MRPGIARMTPARSTSIHILASACPPSTGSSSIPQRAAEVPIGPANATERSSSANPAFENRRRPLRPASDVTDIRPHLTDAAGDLYAALGSDCHRADFSFHPDRWHRTGSPEGLPGAGDSARALVSPVWLLTPGGTGVLRPWAVSAFAIS